MRTVEMQVKNEPGISGRRRLERKGQWLQSVQRAFPSCSRSGQAMLSARLTLGHGHPKLNGFACEKQRKRPLLNVRSRPRRPDVYLEIDYLEIDAAADRSTNR